MIHDRHSYSALAELLPLLRMNRFEQLVLARDVNVDDGLRQLLLVAHLARHSSTSSSCGGPASQAISHVCSIQLATHEQILGACIS